MPPELSLLDWILRQAASLYEKTGDVLANEVIENTLPQTESVIQLDLIARHHNTTIPSEFALGTMGYSFKSVEPFPLKPEPNEATHDESMVSLWREIRRLRKVATTHSEPVASPGIDLVVSQFAPSILVRHLISRFREKRSPAATRVLESLKSMRNQRSHLVEVPEGTIVNETTGPEGPLFHERRQELDALTHAVALKCSEQFAPAIRIPPTPRVFQRWRDLATLSLSDPNLARRRAQLARRAANHFMEAVPEDIRACIARSRGHLKLISDWPIELLPDERMGVPLSVSSVYSRLPTVPGDLLVERLTQSTPIHLPYTVLQRILVVRSFLQGDPVGHLLEMAVRADDRFNNIVFEDVNTTDDIMRCVQKHHPTILVFDMHGQHRDGATFLVLGGKKWDGRFPVGYFGLPPIVIHSTCSSVLSSNTYTNVSSRALQHGAVTVIGTLIPVDAAQSAILMWRLLHRIYAYIPIRLRGGTYFERWNVIWSGMMKMGYTRDITEHLIRNNLLDQDARLIGIATNLNINREVGNTSAWWQAFITTLATRTKRSSAWVRAFIWKNLYFTESCAYTLMGSPENIFLFDPERQHLNRTD